MNKTKLDKLIEDYIQAKILYYTGITGSSDIWEPASKLHEYDSFSHTRIYQAINRVRDLEQPVTRQSIMSTLNDTQSSP